MKAKNILYLLAGICNCVFGGLMVLFSLMAFLIKGTIRSAYIQSEAVLKDFVEELVSIDEEFSYLLDYSSEQVVDFIMKLVTIFAVCVLVMGLIWIAFGVFNILFSSVWKFEIQKKKGWRITFVVISWLLLWFNVSNILTTIAAFLKVKIKDKTPLYSASV